MSSLTIFKLAFSLVTISTSLGVSDYSRQYQCRKSDAEGDIYVPLCDQPQCTTEVHNPTSFPCVVGNIVESNPGTCKAAKDLLKEKQSEMLISAAPWSTGSAQDIDCYARLSSVELFVLSCLNSTEVHEVSLQFSFRIPDCDLKTLHESKAVMVNFNGRNDTVKNHYTTQPTCRTFNYTGASFTEQDVRNFPPIPYNCMAVGLRHGYPHTYYYLGLTSLPAGNTLNYTIVFEEGDFMTHISSDSRSSNELVKDSKTKSLRLLAAAWLSPQAIHVLFSPLEELVTYQVELKSEGWSTSKNVTAAHIEMQNVTPGASAVQVIVTAIDSQACSSGRCPSISVTLHKGGNSFEVPPPSDGPRGAEPEPSILVLFTCIAVFSGIITSALVVLGSRYFWPKKESQKLFVIGKRTDRTEQVTRDLKKHAQVTWIQDILWADLGEKLRSSDKIFFILMSQMNGTSQDLCLQEFMPYCLPESTRRKTRVVLVDAFNEKPSELLEGLDLPEESLNTLDDIERFHWPQDKAKMIKCLSNRSQNDDAGSAEEGKELCRKTCARVDAHEDEITPFMENSPAAFRDKHSSFVFGEVHEPFPIGEPCQRTDIQHGEDSMEAFPRSDSQTCVKVPFSLEVQRGSISQNFSHTDSSFEVGRRGDGRICRAAPTLQEPIQCASRNGRHLPQENLTEVSSSNMNALPFGQPYPSYLHPNVQGTHYFLTGQTEAGYVPAAVCHRVATNTLINSPGQSMHYETPHQHVGFHGRTRDLSDNSFYSCNQSADSGIQRTPGSCQQSAYAPQIEFHGEIESSNGHMGQNISRTNQRSGQELRMHYILHGSGVVNHDVEGVNHGGIVVNHSGVGVNHGGAGVNHGGVGVNNNDAGVNFGGVVVNHGGIVVNHSGVGVNHGGIVVNRSGVGVNHGGIVVNHSGVGVNHGGVGVNHGGAGVNHGGAGVNHGGAEESIPGREGVRRGEEILYMGGPSAEENVVNMQIPRGRQSPEENVDDASSDQYDSGQYSLNSLL